VRYLPTASTLPLKNRDLGTSRWQLKNVVSGTYISAKDVGRGVAITGALVGQFNCSQRK
jgi:hypothetical protein